MSDNERDNAKIRWACAHEPRCPSEHEHLMQGAYEAGRPGEPEKIELRAEVVAFNLDARTVTYRYETEADVRTVITAAIRGTP